MTGSSAIAVGLNPADDGQIRFGRLFATGGIGHGILFSLEGNATLGRNESRPGRLERVRDYGKLQIIAHYVSVLLGAGRGGRLEVIPIGRVGEDEAGHRLVAEMRQDGMSVEEVAFLAGSDTSFSVCFLYPDTSGGNLTTAESAGSRLTPDDIDAALERHPPGDTAELFLAVPEVPIPARVRLLERGRERGGFTVSSVLPSEVEAFTMLCGLEHTDLLAVNIDEARAFAGAPLRSSGFEVAQACAARVREHNDRMLLAVTEGRGGGYRCERDRVERFRGLTVPAASTAGAGDAFLAGVICGLCCGLPFLGDPATPEDHSPVMSSAVDLGNVVGAMSVMSPHAIHPGITPASIRDFLRQQGLSASAGFSGMFAGCREAALA